MPLRSTKSIIRKGMDFLEREYKNDEHFGFGTLFPTILIADCLNQTKIAKNLAGKLVKNILAERSAFFSFNYWYKNTNNFKDEPYPDDLDDTFCALSAILRFNKNLIKGGDLAKIINLLILCEEHEGGPYRTWILSKEKSKDWDDVDIAVNSNVAYFLKLNDIELENITSFVENKIKSNDLISPFYKGNLPVIYFISRFYNGDQKTNLAKKLLPGINKESSSLELALAISSLIRLNYKKKIKQAWINILKERQSIGGWWEADDFYYYVDKKSKRDYIGGQSITTAFVLEALSLWDIKEIKEKKLNEIKQKIYKKARKKINCLPNDLKHITLDFLKKIFNGDKEGVITLTPMMTFLSLKEEYKKKIKENFLITLGLINLFGWCAYTIYDDIIDGDSEVKHLSMANAFNREMEILFNNLEIDKTTGFFEFYKQVMQEAENANYWESNNLNYDKDKMRIVSINTDRLADKSMGHALTSIAILCKLGFSIKSDEIKNMIGFFKNFLIAKQMNDDMHDWENDLDKGKINSASVKLLELAEETKEQRILFWKKVVPLYGKQIICYSERGEKLIKKIGVFKNKKYFTEMIDKNKIIAKKAMEEREKTLGFIRNYC